MIGKIFDFVFDNPLGKLAAGLVGLGALVAAFALQQRSLGAQKERARTTEAAHAQVKKADDTRTRVRLRPPSGMRDPYQHD